jgi:hypothetical protein
MAGQKAHSMAESGKHELADQIGQFAKALRLTGDKLREEESGFSGYTDTIANQAERLSHYLHQHPTDDLLGEVESFARRRPALFLGGAFALGLLAGRFAKSSARHDDAPPELAEHPHEAHPSNLQPGAAGMPPIGGF